MAEIESYTRNIPFSNWAKELKEYYNDAEPSELISKALGLIEDKHVRNLAVNIEEFFEDWEEFVEKINCLLGIPKLETMKNFSVLTQNDIKSDFSGYVMLKSSALKKSFPDITDKELLISILSGMSENYFELFNNGFNKITSIKEVLEYGEVLVKIIPKKVHETNDDIKNTLISSFEEILSQLKNIKNL